jgi:hypothetical protein
MSHIVVNERFGGLSVDHFDVDPGETDRTGFYNMTTKYWMREEFPVWKETASIRIYAVDGICGILLC